MPTYEYRCSSCKSEHEIYQSIKDAPKKVCPACGGKTLERLISGGGAVLFKGSGFYETDYRSANYKKAAEAEQKAPSGGDTAKKPDTAAETKPAGATKAGDKGAKKGAGEGAKPAGAA